MPLKKILYIFLTAVAILTVSALQAKSSVSYRELALADTLNRRVLKVKDTLMVSDSSKFAISDSLIVADSLVATDSLMAADSAKNKSSIDFPVFSTARDSIVEDFTNGKRMIYFYGDVSVKYDNLEIKSDYMAYDVESRTVFAKGLPDTSGTVVGKPVMTQGENSYEMESVYYNFDTEKAKIKNMITQEGDGYLHGQFLKKMPDNSINISKGKYTEISWSKDNNSTNTILKDKEGNIVPLSSGKTIWHIIDNNTEVSFN